MLKQSVLMISGIENWTWHASAAFYLRRSTGSDLVVN